MIKKIKPSLSEKILFIFLILLIILTLGSFYILNNKCFFVKKIDLNNIDFKDKQNIAIMEVECGNVLIELDPKICLLYTSPSPRDLSTARMPSSA